MLWAFCLLGIIAYLVILYFARDIETTITFPGKDINLKEIMNHPAGLIVAEDIFIETDAWETIHGVYIDNKAEKTVYYFHGNGAPMQHFYTEMRYISDLGYNLIAYDYPGYGKSTGEPNLENIQRFSELFYSHMKETFWVQDENVVVWGYSIGTALAIDFARDKDFGALVLFSPLASRYEMSETFFGFPVQKLFFLPNSLISQESINEIEEPTLIVHGNKDIVVPIEQGRIVYENSPAQKKKFIEVDDFWHSLIIERYGDALRDLIIDFLWEKQIQETEKEEIEEEREKDKHETVFLNRKIATGILKKQQEMKRIVELDIISDDSVTKYVDPEVSFETLDYIPVDLQKVSSEFIRDVKWDLQLRSVAAESFKLLAQDFYENFWEKIDIVSSYRSYNYQAGIKSRGCPDTLCAKAGHSEHQSGLALDVWEASSAEDWNANKKLYTYFKWLSENAHLYGWHNPYRNGVDIDGYESEPWHWRYLWVELSSYLHEQNVTFAEYYKARMRNL